MADESGRAAARSSDYVLVAGYLKTLACPACGGVGWRAGGKDCKFCETTGFRTGDVHLLVSAQQTRRR